MAPRPLAPPEKSTTVYVGKIAASVDDSLIRSLLDACGTVRSWKPLQDPETQKPKGFGFCEFEDAEGVLRALRLLNSLSLDGQELLLKCNTATQKCVVASAALLCVSPLPCMVCCGPPVPSSRAHKLADSYCLTSPFDAAGLSLHDMHSACDIMRQAAILHGI